MAKHRNNKQESRENVVLLYIWFVLLALYPLVSLKIFPGMSKIAENFSYTKEVSGYSYTYFDPNMLWVYPKVFLLLFFTVTTIPYIIKYISKYIKTMYIKLLIIYSLLIILNLFYWLFTGICSIDCILLGDNGRGIGILYIFSLIIFAIISYIIININYEKSKIIFYVGISVGTLLESVVAISQYIGYDIVQNIEYTGHIIIGTIGNNGMLAGILLVGIAAILVLGMKVNGNVVLIAAINLFVAAFALGITQNRTATFSIYIVAIIFLIPFLYKKMFLIYLKKWIIMYLIIIMATMLGWNGKVVIDSFGISRSQTAIRNITSTTTLKTRFQIWKISLEELTTNAEHIFYGYGPRGLRAAIIQNHNYDQLIDFYMKEYRWKDRPVVKEVSDVLAANPAVLLYFPLTNTIKISRVNLDKAHNLWLDEALNYGILAALIMLIFYFYPIITIIKQFVSAHHITNECLIAYSHIAGLAALVIYYMLWFPVPQVEPLHIAYVAMAYVLVQRHPCED